MLRAETGGQGSPDGGGKGAKNIARKRFLLHAVKKEQKPTAVQTMGDQDEP